MQTSGGKRTISLRIQLLDEAMAGLDPQLIYAEFQSLQKLSGIFAYAKMEVYVQIP
jgi:hypothetical protein